jgi:hypothetical protein
MNRYYRFSEWLYSDKRIIRVHYPNHIFFKLGQDTTTDKRHSFSVLSFRLFFVDIGIFVSIPIKKLKKGLPENFEKL